MLKVQTKLTSQGQVSVPAAVRHALGLGPGAMIEWTHEGDSIIVRRAVRSSTANVHAALFPGAVADTSANTSAKTLAELKQGIRQHLQRRHARG